MEHDKHDWQNPFSSIGDIDRLSRNHTPDVAAHMADLLSNKGETKMPTTKSRIRSDIQAKVDEYIEIDAQVKKLQAELKKLRPDIEEYMDKRKLTVIAGSERGSVSLQPRNLAIVNSRYTSYDIDGIMPLLDAKAQRQCIVKAVDKEVLELLVKTGQAPKEVEKFKLFKESVAFIISHK